MDGIYAIQAAESLSMKISPNSSYWFSTKPEIKLQTESSVSCCAYDYAYGVLTYGELMCAPIDSPIEQGGYSTYVVSTIISHVFVALSTFLIQNVTKVTNTIFVVDSIVIFIKTISFLNSGKRSTTQQQRTVQCQIRSE